MRYEFLIETYETERVKVVSAWSMFIDQDLPIRPHPADNRGRSLHEHMVHQCVSEDFWFRTMLDIDVGAPPLPKEETRFEFMRQYAEDSGKRLAVLRENDDMVGRRDDVLRRTPIARLGYDSPHDAYRPSSGSAVGPSPHARARRTQQLRPHCGYRWPDAKQRANDLCLRKPGGAFRG